MVLEVEITKINDNKIHIKHNCDDDQYDYVRNDVCRLYVTTYYSENNDNSYIYRHICDDYYEYNYGLVLNIHNQDLYRDITIDTSSWETLQDFDNWCNAMHKFFKVQGWTLITRDNKKLNSTIETKNCYTSLYISRDLPTSTIIVTPNTTDTINIHEKEIEIIKEKDMIKQDRLEVTITKMKDKTFKISYKNYNMLDTRNENAVIRITNNTRVSMYEKSYLCLSYNDATDFICDATDFICNTTCENILTAYNHFEEWSKNMKQLFKENNYKLTIIDETKLNITTNIINSKPVQYIISTSIETKVLFITTACLLTYVFRNDIIILKNKIENSYAKLLERLKM